METYALIARYDDVSDAEVVRRALDEYDQNRKVRKSRRADA
jgi:hypothetical protein